MANIDTGLGWYAESEWLAESPGTIASLESSGGGGGGTVDTGLGWFAKAEYLKYQQYAPLARLLSSSFGNRNVQKGYEGYAIAVLVEATDYSGVVTISTIRNNAYQWMNGYLGPGISFSYLGMTWYCCDSLMYEARLYDGADNVNVPIYTISGNYGSSKETHLKGIIDAAGVSAPPTITTYNKSSSGFSITCICKWITSYGGDVYFSPVLISSEPNSTLYTRDNTTPSVNNTEHQYQGMTFYMRKAPLDTLTGEEEITSSYPLVDLSGVAQTNDTIFSAIAYQSGLTVGQVDPYSGAGESEPGAEEATFDFDSTAIDFGTPPTVTAAGMVELYIPSTSNLASLAQYLWAGSFDPDNFKKLFADPMDAIIGLQIVPVTAAEIGTTPDTLYVGNISTGLSMPKASRQYVPVDCGSLTIPRRLGSYLDYSPHTEMQLYLPYIGFVDISPDDCMGGTVSVKYLVDIIGGTCVAQVKCNNHVLYEYAAACSCQVPVSAGQYQNIVLGAVRGGVGLVSGILGAAGGGLLSGLSEAADAAMSMTKPKIQRSGGFGGSSGLMGHQTPYIIYTVPRLIVPGRQNNFIGYPSYITRTLGDLTGFTQIDSIHLSGIPASQSEQAEIEQLLQEGVYL